MSKFRLNWARRCGEQKAAEYGFTSFPIDPFEIAEKAEILVEAKPPDMDGVSGGIIFSGDDVGIFYSTAITNEGFQRFTVGHELGHYFLEGHPAEIMKAAPMHISRAGFTEGGTSIEIEADHFSSGLLLPTKLVTKELLNSQIGIEGIIALSEVSECSLTACAIRAAECSPYPMAIVVSKGDQICYGFLSEGFKRLGQISFPRKGMKLPQSATSAFNSDPQNVQLGRKVCAPTSLADWFDGPGGCVLDEEVVGLGSYGFTLSVFSSEELPDDPDDDKDEETELIESYTPKFAYGR
jgi:Zn-dependent peptidase ImmA (M78 family)